MLIFLLWVCRNGSSPRLDDNKDGHYMFELGEDLTSRYKIHNKMGEGTFGQVLECWDREKKEMVAIKIFHGIKKYHEAAMIEIEMLQQIGKHDKGGNRCVQIQNWVDYSNHICVVFEKLGPSLYDFLWKNNYRSFSIDLVREIEGDAAMDSTNAFTFSPQSNYYFDINTDWVEEALDRFDQFLFKPLMSVGVTTREFKEGGFQNIDKRRGGVNNGRYTRCLVKGFKTTLLIDMDLCFKGISTGEWINYMFDQNFVNYQILVVIFGSSKQFDIV
ncbi:hypothetical protein F2P56_024345 [Juglans regia]|uniref:Dual specificity tyrosine-phosphorylation-regulated kinase mbk-1-like isoform X1 n=2 Tax=Juglans regia TaxID=51240 RepID=A0A6P9DUZ5_JUGRE|nr:dual specificity tyrosine-phosphorylation-regulated kinase mbk-1-like isoform X1 [Juglans regia]XP_035538957.1 dual specificity tyrosine-phosphorylation-regulated kinase mbk-1-like isoform X1 [Juglans regia]KAF5454699.1 hypothetical protein F2P56_024345 [Juglans regia]